jgi:hypothetical protein
MDFKSVPDESKLRPKLFHQIDFFAGVCIDVFLQHRLLVVETVMFRLDRHDEIWSVKKLETMSHLDVAVKVPNKHDTLGSVFDFMEPSRPKFTDKT